MSETLINIQMTSALIFISAVLVRAIDNDQELTDIFPRVPIIGGLILIISALVFLITTIMVIWS